MKLITVISTTLLLPAGLMLSVSAQAHTGGHKLNEAQCSAVWAKASSGGKAEAISVDQKLNPMSSTLAHSMKTGTAASPLKISS